MSEGPSRGSDERFGAPERLDRVLYVTTPKAWLALVVLLALLAALAVWAVLGAVPTYVRADGVIVRGEGMVFDAAPSSAGRLVRLRRAVGETVAAGDVVAEIFDAETMERQRSAGRLVEERARILRDRESERRQENRIAEQNLARQRSRLEELEETGRALIAAAEERLEAHREMVEQGLESRISVENSEQNLDIARRNLFDVLRRQDDLEADDLRRRHELRSRVAAARTALTEAESRLEELDAELGTWEIRAPAAGRVTEVKEQVGASLAPGDPVLSIETGAEGLEVLLYVSPADGKSVEPGMRALVSPHNLRREEYGSMTGTVHSLSEFPATSAGLTYALQNTELVEALAVDGPLYTGRVVLERDPDTASGIAWSSPQGEGVAITSGTLASVEIEVRTRSPISLVAPYFRKRLGR